MRKIHDQVLLSATDLIGHINCGHLTNLDIQVINGTLAKPSRWDPLLEILRERGFRHEQAFIDYLRSSGLDVIAIEGVDNAGASVKETLDAMKAGREIIVQGSLRSGRWAGRADILRRVSTPSVFGGWSYEVTDTKLARETKGGTVLQLCLYSEMLAAMQQHQPDFAHVVAPWTKFVPHSYRMADFAAYFRKAKAAVERVTEGQPGRDTYPEPNDHCDVCRWSDSCDKQRRADDHLSYVAGISRNQITELRENGIDTLAGLAGLPNPMTWKPKRGALQSYEKVKSQALLQFEARKLGERRYELLGVHPGFGLCALPEPSPGDIFFDLEGDPFVGEHGLEYLFGYHFHDENGNPLYQADWAFNRTEEKNAFEHFVDFATDRRSTYPDLHIYHFAPYEPAALKRLMGRYASRENEIDDLLRGLVFVDLYSVVRNALRASVESYSIKRLEAFYSYERVVPLSDANIALASLQAGLELADKDSISPKDRDIVQGYNQDDCVSTEALRNWLETLRSELESKGTVVPRPTPGQDGPSEEISERQERVNRLVERLTSGIPVDPAERNEDQHAQWILANVLDWHRREDKATWWEHFRLKALSADELLDERAALSGLEYITELPKTGKVSVPTHRYTFPQQDTDIRAGKKLRSIGGDPFGEVVSISTEMRTLDIKKTGAAANIHPAAIYVHEIVPSKEQAACLLRIADHVAYNGLNGAGPYLAARDLLLRIPPRVNGQPIQNEGEFTLDAALRLATHFEGGVLPIQGPPGTGKSYTGARMICAFVQRGMKVGITANSHKVVRNLLEKVLEAADEMKVDLCCVQKAKEKEDDQPHLKFAKDNSDLFAKLASGQCHVAGATGFLWSAADAHDVLDVLVVDEAAQMSLANVLAVSHAATRLILLGDPQQLDQPTQGTHPDGTGVSSLEHVLGGKQTIDPNRGLFLAETWRMNPPICDFDSELFYESKLHPVAGCEKQVILSKGPIIGSGLRYIPVEHAGNKSYSIEEAGVVTQIVMTILSSNTRWIDRDGTEKPVRLEDIVIITPYNAQVFEIQQRHPGVRVGTVDKFQGQEAPIAIYSMATSTHADAPRGMEFLYSANRFNVAISRAKCLAILVASPEIFEAECKTPRQMQLANAFCRYIEMTL
ncbi:MULTISPECIES: TM0106 family RecB-like putative nuclease [unclassified Mesorhizobium]|uniref:TM0106 family RecB-like putative nuclease n=1 Tax=unclassified Mesorhizobium TaxID=325217 RepID=UPI0003CECEFD|nr:MULTISPECIES: TM0106 family RecB-like putative nuclease [unclassified Mesorhizobium]ESY55394.1 RecB family nuclease [Mesorhizobium sp. LNJC374B00]ESY56981.1 RecB family nuclease [Mesorhizobium sp. LNJC372A00]WJI79389.1 TM0106 family RecB-like putative nuclease [Mesorhizobium sp. C374B]WJI85925.1 TM0106 family RecB-like putative nuclease [Mesorhizobium sp. C372A]